jgi:CheY-like chemotaxis protein
MNKNLNIFVIEDNEFLSMLLKAELEKLYTEKGFTISKFESGEACKNMLHVMPQLVIVDYHLDSKNENAMNGIEVMEMIKQSSPNTDFIMITNNQQTELFLRAKKYGVHDYITKDTHLTYKLNLSIDLWLKLKE